MYELFLAGVELVKSIMRLLPENAFVLMVVLVPKKLEMLAVLPSLP